MRRSSHVLAPLLASTALGLVTGCRSPEMQRCVDGNNHVADPSLCTSGAPGRSGGGSGYHFYYGGSGNYRLGSAVEGGSTQPEAGHSYSTTTGTERGGFGSSFSGDGEGGGHGGGGEGGGGE